MFSLSMFSLCLFFIYVFFISIFFICVFVCSFSLFGVLFISVIFISVFFICIFFISVFICSVLFIYVFFISVFVISIFFICRYLLTSSALDVGELYGNIEKLTKLFTNIDITRTRRRMGHVKCFFSCDGTGHIARYCRSDVQRTNPKLRDRVYV